MRYFTSPGMVKIEIQAITSVVKDTEKLKFSCSVGGNIK